MATGGETKLTDDELKAISKAFEEMGVKPKAESAEDFQKWLLSYAKGAKPKGQDGSSGNGPTQTTFREHPRLPNFSGDKKGDVNFDLWRYEVQCLMRENYSEQVIAHSIRRSVRGEAAGVLMRLGTQANISDILNKFESIYGTIDKKQMLLSKFYSARQDINEDVKSWGCRLEDLLSKVQAVTKIPKPEAEQMLKDLFWEGLKPSLKDATGHIYDKQLPYDELMKEIRKKEEDQKKRDEKKEHTQTMATTAKTEVDELKEMIHNLNADMKQMKDKLSTKPSDDADQYVNSQQYSNFSDYGQPSRQYEASYTQRYGRYYSRNFNRRRGRGYGRASMQQQRDTSDYMYSTPRYTESGEPICMRCGQEGHLALGCRVRLDHQRRPLNSRGPTSRRGR